MPDNRNIGRNSQRNVEIDAYLDSLSPKTSKRDINISDEEVFVKKSTAPALQKGMNTLKKKATKKSACTRCSGTRATNARG